MDDPELVILVPEEEEEPPPPPPDVLARRIVYQIATIILLKAATGIAIRKLSKSIYDFDVLYPEALSKINWKEPK